MAIITEGFFDAYISQQLIRARWSCIRECVVQHVGQQSPLTPDMRSAHQMCIDCDGGQLYLCGGWDGGKELADLWQFTIKSQQWTCLNLDTSQEVCLFLEIIMIILTVVIYRVDQGQSLAMQCVSVLVKELYICLVAIWRLLASRILHLLVTIIANLLIRF